MYNVGPNGLKNCQEMILMSLENKLDNMEIVLMCKLRSCLFCCWLFLYVSVYACLVLSAPFLSSAPFLRFPMLRLSIIVFKWFIEGLMLCSHLYWSLLLAGDIRRCWWISESRGAEPPRLVQVVGRDWATLLRTASHAGMYCQDPHWPCTAVGGTRRSVQPNCHH